MEKSMIPSENSMTYPQTDKGGDVFRSVLRKHRTEFPSDAAQKALGVEGLAKELLAVFRKYVELFSNPITRRVRVNRNQTPEEVLAATGRVQYINKDVVETMPKGEGEKTEVVFLKPGGQMSEDGLEKWFDERGFKLIDPYSLAAVNKADPAFADKHPNGTQWKDADGKWCYIAFGRGDGERCVSVYRSDFGWRDGWWFAGRRK